MRCQNGVENTAGFARLDHVGGEVVKDLGIGAHGIGQGCAALDRGADAEQRLLEEVVLLVVAEDLQALHQGKAGIDHHRELAEEDGLLLGLDRAADLHVEIEAGAFFLDDVGLDAFARQRGAEHLFVFRGALALHLFARRIVSLNM